MTDTYHGGAEIVPSQPASAAVSAAQTPHSQSLWGPKASQQTVYSFINKEFMDDEMDHTGGFGGIGALHKVPMSAGGFRNLTSTPKSYRPNSLPKSLPIDWNLFNKQFELNLRSREAKLKRKRAYVEEFENNFENLPYHVIDFIADCVESQLDLINWSQTCKFFNKMVNKRLYTKIIVVDDINDRCMHYDGKYTLVDSKNYPKLLASLHTNDELLPLITEIVIDTSSNQSSYDSLGENIYSALYDLFLTKDNNLQILENLDFSNLKKFGSLVMYNRDHLIKHNYNKYTNYYHESSSMDELIKRDMLQLDFFQLLDLNDVNKLPSSATSLSIALEHEFQLNEEFKLTHSGWEGLQRLTNLKLHTPHAFDQLINECYKFRNAHSLPRLSHLTILSIASIHKMDDLTHDSRLSFHKLNSVIDLSTVEHLELKLKCHERGQCNRCIVQFMSDWYQDLLTQGDSNLKSLSIISLPPSSNNNVNIQWDSILGNIQFLKPFGQHLQFFFINLNDFPFVPILEKTQELEVQDSLKLPINERILKARKLMYSNLLDSLKELEVVVIPDFFYNWAVYNNISDLSKDENVNFLNFLDSCTCIDCCQARRLFKYYSRQTAFKDFKKRLVTDWRYANTATSSDQYNRLNDDPDSYRILYNYLLRELKSRIPLKQVNKVQSSLDYDKFVPNVYSKSAVIPRNDFEQLTRLMTHGLRGDIQRLLNTLTKLIRFNLGGVLFKCLKLSKDKVRVTAMYDDFSEVFTIVN